VIAARRNKIKELVLPAANRGDYEELPDYVTEGLTVNFVERFREVVKLVFR
jgi:ATP-dependent Lon protease